MLLYKSHGTPVITPHLKLMADIAYHHDTLLWGGSLGILFKTKLPKAQPINWHWHKKWNLPYSSLKNEVLVKDNFHASFQDPPYAHMAWPLPKLYYFEVAQEHKRVKLDILLFSDPDIFYERPPTYILGSLTLTAAHFKRQLLKWMLL